MASLIFIFLIFIFTFVVYRFISYVLSQRRLKFYLNKIPGPPGLPIIGHSLIRLRPRDKLWAHFRMLNKKYYPIYKLWIANYGIVTILHPDDAEILLRSKNISKSQLYDILRPWFGTGLLTSTGKKWQERRKILTPAFHFNILREFTIVFDEEGRRMVEDLKSQNGEVTLNLIPFITKYTLNALCESAMGTSLKKMAKENDNFHQIYRRAVHDLGQSMIHRLQSPWLHSNTIFSLTPWGRFQKKCLTVVCGFSKKIIEERKEFHVETKGIHLGGFDRSIDITNDIKIFKASKKKLAMLDILIAALKNDYIDDNGIWEEINTFMFEGHDTTAMGLCFTILLLAEHQDIQQRAREEVDEIMKNTDYQLSITELQQLNYLERCIKETLRLYPSVPLISRSITEDMQLKNYLVPKGSIAHLQIYDMHRNPNIWPDPLCYDPDRFLPENTQNRHPFSYIPFSGGARNCIGQKFGMLESKAMIGHLLHNFYLEPIDLAADVCLITDLVIRPKHSIRVKFVPR